MPKEQNLKESGVLVTKYGNLNFSASEKSVILSSIEDEKFVCLGVEWEIPQACLRQRQGGWYHSTGKTSTLIAIPIRWSSETDSVREYNSDLRKLASLTIERELIRSWEDKLKSDPKLLLRAKIATLKLHETIVQKEIDRATASLNDCKTTHLQLRKELEILEKSLSA